MNFLRTSLIFVFAAGLIIRCGQKTGQADDTAKSEIKKECPHAKKGPCPHKVEKKCPPDCKKAR